MSQNYLFSAKERKYCILCNQAVDSFLPWQGNAGSAFVRNFDIIGSDPQNFLCPHCNSHDRERHLYLFMKELGLLSNLAGKNALIVAPEINFVKKIYSKDFNLVCGDLHPEKYQHLNINPFYRVDLTNPQFNDESFDIIIANHILEHIIDYPKAISEIYRMLKPEGYAILQTPFSAAIYNNFEDYLIDTEPLRIKYYGQEDHVRIFGLRLFDDIEQCGFKLNLYSHRDILSKYDEAVFGVNHKENLILARK